MLNGIMTANATASKSDNDGYGLIASFLLLLLLFLIDLKCLLDGNITDRLFVIKVDNDRIFSMCLCGCLDLQSLKLTSIGKQKTAQLLN